MTVLSLKLETMLELMQQLVACRNQEPRRLGFWSSDMYTRSVEAGVAQKRDPASANTKINPLDYVGLGN